MLLSLVLPACQTEIDLCGELEHPHFYKLSIGYDWTNVNAGVSEMQVIAYRPYKSLRYLFRAQPDDINHWAIDSLISCLDGEEVKEGERLPEGKFLMRPGDYYLFTYSENKYSTIQGINQYMASFDYDVTDLSFAYTTAFSSASALPGGNFSDWVDYNNAYPFFYDEGSIAYGTCTYTTRAGNADSISFEMKSLSQHINLSYNLHLDNSDIIIDSIKGELSGVSCKKRIVSGYIDMDAAKSGRVLFNCLHKTDGLDVACYADFYGLGFIPPASEEMATGPGILRLAIYLRFTDLDGVENKRTVMAGINLFNTYKNHPITTHSKDYSHHLSVSSEESINIELPLNISIDRHVEVPAEDGLDTWIIDEENWNQDIEI